MKTNKGQFNLKELDTLINQRLNLNTNRRILSEEFNLPFGATLNHIKNPNFLKQNYWNWTQEKRNRFIKILGGGIYFRQTENMINGLLK